MPSIRIKRGTRAQLDAAAAASGLKVGEPYLITDEDRFAMGLSTTTYEVYAKSSEVVAGSGDVVGPASSVDGSIPMFSGTTGKLLAESPLSYALDSNDHTVTGGKQHVVTDVFGGEDTYSNSKYQNVGSASDGTTTMTSGSSLASWVQKSIMSPGGSAYFLGASHVGGSVTRINADGETDLVFSTYLEVSEDEVAARSQLHVFDYAATGYGYTQYSVVSEAGLFYGARVGVVEILDDSAGTPLYNSALNMHAKDGVVGLIASGAPIDLSVDNDTKFSVTTFGELTTGPTRNPGTSGQVFTSGGPGQPASWAALRPALFGKSIYMWMPGTGTTLGINFGTSFTARNSGTSAGQAHPTKSGTNAMTSLSRATFGTGTTATGASGVQSSASVAWRGNAAGLGGFFFFARFGIETLASDMRAFVGLSANNAAMAADPSSWSSTLGVGKDSADANWQIIHKNVTDVGKINTGKAVIAGEVLDMTLFAAPNGGDITVRLVNAVTSEVYVDNLLLTTTNLPATTAFMYMQAHCGSVSGTTAKLLALNRMYCETDL